MSVDPEPNPPAPPPWEVDPINPQDFDNEDPSHP